MPMCYINSGVLGMDAWVGAQSGYIQAASGFVQVQAFRVQALMVRFLRSRQDYSRQLPFVGTTFTVVALSGFRILFVSLKVD